MRRPIKPKIRRPVTRRPKESKRRIVVSTHTIALQEQLISKDLPLLNSVIPREFISILVKGRSNYLSRRRYQLARLRGSALFSDSEAMQLRDIDQWVNTTDDGSLSSLSFRPSASVWDEMASDSDNCLGRKCPTHGKCFYYQARNRIDGAQILVVNHALFFSDLAVKSASDSSFGILPPYDAAILDECHTIESVAGDYMGISLTNGQVEYTLNKLYNPHTGKGLLTVLEMDRLVERVKAMHTALDQMMFDIDNWLGPDPTVTTARVRKKLEIPNPVSEMLAEMSQRISSFADKTEDASRRAEMTGIAKRLQSLATELQSWLSFDDEGSVYWAERSQNRRGNTRIEMHAAPIDLSVHLREKMFQKIPSVIMASATIAIGRTTPKCPQSLTYPPKNQLAQPEPSQSPTDLSSFKVALAPVVHARCA